VFDLCLLVAFLLFNARIVLMHDDLTFDRRAQTLTIRRIDGWPWRAPQVLPIDRVHRVVLYDNERFGNRRRVGVDLQLASAATIELVRGNGGLGPLVAHHERNVLAIKDALERTQGLTSSARDS
jgi:hypothetical protein